MKPHTVRFPDELWERGESAVDWSPYHTSISQVLRECLTEFVEMVEEEQKRHAGPPRRPVVGEVARRVRNNRQRGTP